MKAWLRNYPSILLKLMRYYHKMKAKITQQKVFIVVAHPDDAELTMGMRIKKYLDDNVHIKIVVLSKGGNRGTKIKKIRVRECLSAGKELGLSPSNYIFGDFRDTNFSNDRTSIRKFLENVVAGFSPDCLYTHFPDDYHLDHIITSEEAVVACRSVPTIFYTRSPYSRNFQPNIFFFDTEVMYNFKHRALQCFVSQTLIDPDVIKKFSSVEYLGHLHPNLVKKIYMRFGTKNVFYEPFLLLRKIE